MCNLPLISLSLPDSLAPSHCTQHKKLTSSYTLLMHMHNTPLFSCPLVISLFLYLLCFLPFSSFISFLLRPYSWNLFTGHCSFTAVMDDLCKCCLCPTCFFPPHHLCLFLKWISNILMLSTSHFWTHFIIYFFLLYTINVHQALTKYLVVFILIHHLVEINTNTIHFIGLPLCSSCICDCSLLYQCKYLKLILHHWWHTYFAIFYLSKGLCWWIGDSI